MAGELAFCRYHNVYPDLTASFTGRDDAVVFGMTYDIKAVAAGKRLNLIVPRHKLEDPADYYVLVDVDINQRKAWIVGDVSATEVFNRRNWREDLPVPAYFIRREALRPLQMVAVVV